jgi:hypothetical protein
MIPTAHPPKGLFFSISRDPRPRYDFEVECQAQGWGDPAFVYDEEKDLFRWTDGRFAFSREHADWALLRKPGRLKGWG